MDIRAHVTALNTKRAKVIEELENHLADWQRDNPGQPMGAEAREKADRLNARIDEYDAEVERFVAQETREQEHARLREATDSLWGPAATERAEESESERLRAWFRGEAGKELVIPVAAAANLREAARRSRDVADLKNALLSDTGSSGSLVPTRLATTLYEFMEASVALFRMPTTKITTSSGESIQFPKLAAHTIGTQVIAQGTAIGGTDPTFARMQLDAYKYGALVQIANEVIQDSAVDIVGFLGKDMGRAVGRVIAADLAVGSGSGEPNGIMTSASGAGTITTGGSLIEPTVEKFIDLVYSINEDYLTTGDGCFLVKRSTAGAMRKLRDGAGGTVGAFLWQPSLTNGIQGGEPDSFLGYPVYQDGNLAAYGSAAKTVGFGDASTYYIRQVGDVVIERSDEFAFNVDEATFRAKWRVDGDCIDPTSGGNVGGWNIIRQVP